MGVDSSALPSAALTRDGCSCAFAADGYHSDDGAKWRFDQTQRPYTDGRVVQGELFAEPFGGAGARPDVIGAGIDKQRRSIFFTKNGKLMGTAFEGICPDQAQEFPTLLPTVTLHARGDVCQLNFGERPFMFDLLAFGASDERSAAVVGGGRAGPADVH
jgi:hypothetical protein